MARALLAAGAVVTGAGGAITLAFAAVGVEWLLGLLPPLAIAHEAVRATLVVLGGALLLTMAVHLVVLAGLRRPGRRSLSAAILLAALFTAVSVALGTAAFTSAVTEPGARAVLLGAGSLAVLAAVGYGVATARLVAELRLIGTR